GPPPPGGLMPAPRAARLHIDVRRDAAPPVGRDGEEPKSESAQRWEVRPRLRPRTVVGEGAGRIRPPDLVELTAGHQGQCHRRHPIVTDEDRIAVGTVPCGHWRNYHAPSPGQLPLRPERAAEQ